MFAATILPQPYLGLTKDDRYHMALAHLINKPGFEYYTEFYTRIGQEEGKYLVMDNGLIEGDPRPIDELIEKALIINASELILPDVYQNKSETLREAHDALSYMQHKGIKINTMAVAQGNSFEEWVECATEMLTWPIQTLGIPKVLVSMAGRDARGLALRVIQDRLAEKQTHLLGCWETPLEIKVIENMVRAGEIKPVRGVDSAIAYVYARAGLRMCDAGRPAGHIDFAASDADMEILQFNIDMWREECGTLPPLDSPRKLHRIY